MSDAHHEEHHDSNDSNETTGPMLLVMGLGLAGFLSMGTAPGAHGAGHDAHGADHAAARADEAESENSADAEATDAPAVNLTMDEAAAKEAAAAMLELEKELAERGEELEEVDSDTAADDKRGDADELPSVSMTEPAPPQPVSPAPTTAPRQEQKMQPAAPSTQSPASPPKSTDPTTEKKAATTASSAVAPAQPKAPAAAAKPTPAQPKPAPAAQPKPAPAPPQTSTEE